MFGPEPDWSLLLQGHETVLPRAFSCPGDIDANGTVDSADLGLLLAAWYSDGTMVEGTDINEDGLVNEADLGLLLSLWGNCP